jgi:hypothetical protein
MDWIWKTRFCLTNLISIFLISWSFVTLQKSFFVPLFLIKHWKNNEINFIYQMVISIFTFDYVFINLAID